MAPYVRDQHKVIRRLIQGIGLFVCVNLWLVWNGGFIPWFLKATPPPMTSSAEDISSYFYDHSKGDASVLTWAHAVNSRQLLNAAVLQSKHCIEADVVLKHEDRNVGSMLPIMAHPPMYESDITLQEFIDLTKDGPAALKLDFKSYSALKNSLTVIAKSIDSFAVPLWINADIMTGAGKTGPPPVNGVYLLKALAESGVPATLSLGWSVAYSPTSVSHYSWADVNRMFQLLRSHMSPKQKVTFPVNAALLHNSSPALIWLCSQFDSSLTVYQSKPEEIVDITELLYLRKVMPRSRVYYDLTDKVAKEFELIKDDISSSRVVTDITGLGYDQDSIDSADWIIKVAEPIRSDVRVGENAIWLTGSQAILTSTHIFNTQATSRFQGSITFVPNRVPSEDNASVMSKTSLQIYLFGRDTYDTHPSGIRCNIASHGLLVITADHIKDLQFYEDEKMPVSPDGCYRFDVTASASKVTLSVEAFCKTTHLDEPMRKASMVTINIPNNVLEQPRYSIMLRASDSNSYVILDKFRINN